MAEAVQATPAATCATVRTARFRIDQFTAHEVMLRAVTHAAAGSSGNAWPEMILRRSAETRYDAAGNVAKYAIGTPTATAVRTGRV
jgi:hypothetical protein